MNPPFFFKICTRLLPGVKLESGVEVEEDEEEDCRNPKTVSAYALSSRKDCARPMPACMRIGVMVGTRGACVTGTIESAANATGVGAQLIASPTSAASTDFNTNEC